MTYAIAIWLPVRRAVRGGVGVFRVLLRQRYVLACCDRAAWGNRLPSLVALAGPYSRCHALDTTPAQVVQSRNPVRSCSPRHLEREVRHEEERRAQSVRRRREPQRGGQLDRREREVCAVDVVDRRELVLWTMVTVMMVTAVFCRVALWLLFFDVWACCAQGCVLPKPCTKRHSH